MRWEKEVWLELRELWSLWGNHYVCDACETASGDVWVTDGESKAQERGIWSVVLSMYVRISLSGAHRCFKGPLKPLGLY